VVLVERVEVIVELEAKPEPNQRADSPGLVHPNRLSTLSRRVHQVKASKNPYHHKYTLSINPLSENLFRRHADLLVSEGYADAGYEYIIIDDCWLEKDRDNKTQKLVPDKKRFPSGLNALSDHVNYKMYIP